MESHLGDFWERCHSLIKKGSMLLHENMILQLFCNSEKEDHKLRVAEGSMEGTRVLLSGKMTTKIAIKITFYF